MPSVSCPIKNIQHGEALLVRIVAADIKLIVHPSQEKLEENRKKLEGHVSLLVSSVTSRNDASLIDADGQGRILSSRIENPLCKFGGLAQASGDKDYINVQEVVHSISAKLPYIENIPPYTTWIFLDRYECLLIFFCIAGLWHHRCQRQLGTSYITPTFQ